MKFKLKVEVITEEFVTIEADTIEQAIQEYKTEEGSFTFTENLVSKEVVSAKKEKIQKGY